MMPEKSKISAEIESPPDGVIGTIRTKAAIVLHPCQQTRKVIAQARPLRRRLSAEISEKKRYQARLRYPTAFKLTAKSVAAEKSLVRVRYALKTDSVAADIGLPHFNYYAEFEAACLDTEVDLYWSSIIPRYLAIEATQYEVDQYGPELAHRITALERLLDYCGKQSASYLVRRRINSVDVTATDDSRIILRTAYTHRQFIEQFRLFENSLLAFFLHQLEGEATRISFTIGREELIK